MIIKQIQFSAWLSQYAYHTIHIDLTSSCFSFGSVEESSGRLMNTGRKIQFDYQCNQIILPTDWYIPQVIISRPLGNQVVNVHIAGLSNTVHSIFCLNKNLQEKKHWQKKWIKCFLPLFSGSDPLKVNNSLRKISLKIKSLFSLRIQLSTDEMKALRFLLRLTLK